MNDDAFWVCVLVICTALFVGLITGFSAYDRGHEDGYYKGFEDSKLYQEATGSFPTKDWIEASSGRHFDNIWDILDTLKPYGD